jgi:hypothetical protein
VFLRLARKGPDPGVAPGAEPRKANALICDESRKFDLLRFLTGLLGGLYQAMALS